MESSRELHRPSYGARVIPRFASERRATVNAYMSRGTIDRGPTAGPAGLVLQPAPILAVP